MNNIKGVDKKTLLVSILPTVVVSSWERSSGKKDISKIEKQGAANGPSAYWLWLPVLKFLKDCFFWNSDRNETQKSGFFKHPLMFTVSNIV